MTPYYLLDHPNPTGPNYYTTRRKPIRLLVVHTAENLPDFDPPDSGAEAVAHYAATTTRNVSWHATIDADSIIPMLPDEYTAFHVAGYNSESLGVEISARAAGWVSTPLPWRLATLDNCARVLAQWSVAHHIPLVLLSAADVAAGKKGVVGHHILDPTQRTDPGPSFPWDYVLDRAHQFAGGLTTSGTRIMGPASATVAQMVGYWKAQASKLSWPTDLQPATVGLLAAAYLEIGAEEGVDGAVGFAQSLKETGLFGWRTPTGERPASGYAWTQWNMAGIGATGAGTPGEAWPSLRDGVRGHLRRLRMYAAGTAALHDLVVLQRPLPSTLWGAAPTVEALGGRWAPSPDYGRSIVDHYLTPIRGYRPHDGVSDWARPAWEWAEAVGLLTVDSQPQETVTVERLMVWLHRLEDTR